MTEIDYGFEQLLGPLPAAWPDGQHHHSFADDPWFVGGHPFTPRHAVIWGAATTVHAWAFMQVRSRFGAGHPALTGFPPYLLELAPGPGLETVVAGDRCPTQPRARSGPVPQRCRGCRTGHARIGRPSPGGAATTWSGPGVHIRPVHQRQVAETRSVDARRTTTRTADRGLDQQHHQGGTGLSRRLRDRSSTQHHRPDRGPVRGLGGQVQVRRPGCDYSRQ